MVLGLTETPETYARRTERLRETCRIHTAEALSSLTQGDLETYLIATDAARQAGELLRTHLQGARRSA